MSRSIDLNGIRKERTSASRCQVREESRASAALLDRTIVLVLVLLVASGFGLRASGVGEIGFAEDEINKIEAARSYHRGDITPNAEHPMIMKTLIYVSMRAAGLLDGARSLIFARASEEAIIRLPNIIFGALTVIPLYLLTATFFDRRTALCAAALWTFGINAITYNRIAKEDTLLVFFMLYAFYFYLRAKLAKHYEPEVGAKKRYYVLSGASFGLMLASKYFPHYFGLNMLYYHLVRVREKAPGETPGKTPYFFYLIALITFLIANPAVLLPHTWAYAGAYTSESLLTHHGYLMGEHLYANLMSETPFGTPVYFYLLFLLIKTPLPLLVALLAGLIVIVRHRRHPGHAFLLLMFVLWIVPYSLAGAKWLRYTLSLMPFLYMIASLGIVWMADGCAGLIERAKRVKIDTGFVTVTVTLLFIASLAWTAYGAGPHYALYTNTLGGRDAAGYYFPHDEFYDDGLREAIRFVCEHAPPGAVVAHETPGVVRFYLEKFGRRDLDSRVLSDPQFSLSGSASDKPMYVILQRGRTYFENREKMVEVRARFKKVYDGVTAGARGVEVYIHMISA